MQRAGTTLALQCPGFSLRWLLSLPRAGSRALGLQELQHVGSGAVAPRLSCSEACGTFPGQGSNHVFCVGRQTLYHWVTRQVTAFFWLPLSDIRAFLIIWLLPHFLASFSACLLCLDVRPLQHTKAVFPDAQGTCAFYACVTCCILYLECLSYLLPRAFKSNPGVTQRSLVSSTPQSKQNLPPTRSVLPRSVSLHW